MSMASYSSLNDYLKLSLKSASKLNLKLKKSKFYVTLEFQPEGPCGPQKPEESASHHISFAQLRAEDSQNNSQRAYEIAGNLKSQNWGTPEN